MLFSIVILVILIGINAFFASSEIAFISLNDAKIEKQAKASSARKMNSKSAVVHWCVEDILNEI